MKKEAMFVFLLIVFAGFACAHQPRLVFDKMSSDKNPFIVSNPDVSQAYYAELKGAPDYYLISSTESFELYINLLVPDVKNADKDYSAVVISDEGFLDFLNGSSAEWEPFHEEFAGDDYFWGPEMSRNVSAGLYLIEVYSPDNEGKYVFVVGKKESFPLNEQINTFFSLPKMKEYFGKSPLTAYFNLVGLFMLGYAVALIVIILVVIFIIKRLVKHKKRKSGNN
jgi:hypothetical protein